MRPLRELYWKRSSSVDVEVLIRGKAYVLFNSDNIGSPAHTETIQLASLFKELLKFDRPRDLPIVTDLNADHFSFDPSSEAPFVKDSLPVGVRETAWEPIACRATPAQMARWVKKAGPPAHE